MELTPALKQLLFGKQQHEPLSCEDLAFWADYLLYWDKPSEGANDPLDKRSDVTADPTIDDEAGNMSV